MWQLNNDYTVTDGAGEVTFSYQVKNGAAWADVNDVPTNVGTYRVKAVVAENDNYKGAETDWKEFQRALHGLMKHKLLTNWEHINLGRFIHQKIPPIMKRWK